MGSSKARRLRFSTSVSHAYVCVYLEYYRTYIFLALPSLLPVPHSLEPRRQFVFTMHLSLFSVPYPKFLRWSLFMVIRFSAAHC